MSALARTAHIHPEAPVHQMLASHNDALARLDAPGRLAWAFDALPDSHVLSSSFGAQSAVLLHMATRLRPQIPVVVVDTGYLFPETYAFIDQLQDRLQLNLIVAQAVHSPAWLEARHGKLWEHGVEGLTHYNQLRKVAPMQAALDRLGAGTWIAGPRRNQSRSRQDLPFLQHRAGRYKLHPLADWSDRDIGRYLQRHDLPYHPLWERGYVSIGDTHSTRPLEAGMAAEDTRFAGLKRECGLHEGWSI